MNILIDENMPRSLAPQLIEVGCKVQDVRDIGLREQPDTEVMAIAVQQYAIIYGDAAVGYPASHDNGSTL